MRSPLAFALLFCGCSGAAVIADPPPSQILCRLKTRDRVLTVYAADAPVRFAVHELGPDGPGRRLAAGSDLAALDRIDPRLGQAFHGALAQGPLLAD